MSPGCAPRPPRARRCGRPKSWRRRCRVSWSRSRPGRSRPATTRRRRGGALTFTTWNTGAPQQPGMWFQVELPEAVRLTEIQFESPGGGRGGGGGGAAAAAQRPRRHQAMRLRQCAAGSTPRRALRHRQPRHPRRRRSRRLRRRHRASYKVEVSMDGTSWGRRSPRARARGQSTAISFAPVRARYVRITQTGTAEPPTPGRFRGCGCTKSRREVGIGFNFQLPTPKESARTTGEIVTQLCSPVARCSNDRLGVEFRSDSSTKEP